jgi:Alcohol dehydrogenase GroES-like domain
VLLLRTLNGRKEKCDLALGLALSWPVFVKVDLLDGIRLAGAAAAEWLAFGYMAPMRAVVAERPDGPEGLVVREVPRSNPRPGWALVRVEAFGLNRSENKTLKGYAGDAVTFPRILGIELVGVVEEVDNDAPVVPPGTTVAALMGEMGRAFDGGYAEYALVP